MAKQIKVIKCPQCGNTKPLSTGNDHYRCDKCGTEFFLDNDDVNINVNHNYDSGNNGRSGKSALFIIFFVIFVLILLTVKVCVDQVNRINRNVTTYTATERPAIQYDKYVFSMLLPVNGQGIAFYLTNKNKNTYASFENVVTGKPVKEQQLPVKITDSQHISHRWFLSDSTHYVIINENLIYKIDPDNYTFTDITTDICARKPALNAGLMSISFIKEGQGEGFLIHTNLGKDLYYFLASDMLYTEKAFKYVANDFSNPLLPNAKNEKYYLFLNKESAHSSNVAQLYEIIYKFNNGGPENKMLKLSEQGMKNISQHRIVSCKSITDERVYFSPEILYYDPQNILIAYQPSLAKDAGINVQLLDASGNIIWTKPFNNNGIKNTCTVRTNQGFMLQLGESEFCEISVDGQRIQTYKKN